MEVILKKDVKHLGYKDDKVSVKPGFGRNYLIPQGMAIVATPSMKKVHAETLRQRAHKEEKVKAEATKMAAKLQEMVVKVGAKVGEKGKIFGSVNSINVAEALEKLGVKVDRKNITMKEDAIKHTGKYEAEVKLHREVSATVSFEVVGE